MRVTELEQRWTIAKAVQHEQGPAAQAIKDEEWAEFLRTPEIRLALRMKVGRITSADDMRPGGYPTAMPASTFVRPGAFMFVAHDGQYYAATSPDRLYQVHWETNTHGYMDKEQFIALLHKTLARLIKLEEDVAESIAATTKEVKHGTDTN